MKEVFEKIIHTHYWKDVVCGSGSTLEYTKGLRDALPEFVAKHNIQTMFDAPCGDYSWMSLVEFPPGFVYSGGDIVPSLVEQNQKNHPNIEFRNFDLSQDPIPTVDMLFCRDCLFHLSLADIDLVLDNIARSSVKYVLLTSHHSGNNQDINTGSYRMLNFMSAPYNFPDPVDSIEDWLPGHAARSMRLWPRSVFERYVNETKNQ